MVTGLFQDLTHITKARNGRLASWDQRGQNQDYWEIPAGEAITLGEIEGPGCINHIWMTSSCRRVKKPSILDPELQATAAPVMEIHPALGVIWDEYDPYYYRKALIRITWDDQKTPSVLAPLGDFFCIGNCWPGNFTSLPFNVSLKPEEAGRYGAPCSVSCYFPMPFNKRAKIEIVNENDVPFILYFNIDYEMYPQPLGPETAYFHASWHRENPCKGWGPEIQVNSPEVNMVSNLKGENNYVVLETQGTGHYVGCNLTVKHFQGSWWGEGNDMFFIDGEEYPSLNGTGTEDYFNHAWGMQRNAFPFFGTIVHESQSGDFQVSYRFHITDPVRFEKSIKVTIEHGHANHLADDWSSTAYWYQLLPTAPALTIQSVEERLPVVPQLPPRQAVNVELTKEQRAARQSYAQREEAYFPKREKQFRIKEEKCRRESQLNTEFAAALRKRYDEINQEK
ncbi:glycoside hydrolase family 172 protein [Allofournierella sp.]|uniref:glycoside hydrolase family 172 protein n=1 Tax=Allofournierella sp. TaxID=1940256 RepID=UPI003AB3CF06